MKLIRIRFFGHTAANAGNDNIATGARPSANRRCSC